MGHISDYIVVEKRSNILKAAENFAQANVDRQENPQGRYHGDMTIHDDRIYEDYDAAAAAIRSFDNGFYDDHAVKFYDYDYSLRKPTKKIEDLRQRIEKLGKKYREYEEAHHINNLKAKFITCPECKSKISNERWHRNTCPVCRKDMRAAYITEKLSDYSKKQAALRKELDSLYERNQKKNKPKEKWLVKVEVHC